MSERACVFCSGAVDPVEAGDDDTCETCWYEMRQEPEQFKQRMKRGVSLRPGALGWHRLEDGTVIHVNAAPFEVGPVKSVKP